MNRHPSSTYRLQIREAFDLDAAASVTAYLRDLSFRTDLKVLARTVRVVIHGTGC